MSKHDLDGGANNMWPRNRLDPVDVPGDFDSVCIGDINDALMEAKILAQRVDILAHDGADMGDIHSAISSDVFDVADQLRYYEQEAFYTYGGEGFVPIYDYDQELGKTAFVRIVRARGLFSGINLLDPRDFGFLSKDYEEDDADIDSNVAVENYGLDPSEGVLATPLYRPRLYMEFKINEQVDTEVCVGGIALRSFHTSHFNIMDLSKLEIEHVEINQQEGLIEEYEIPQAMINHAKSMRQTKRSTVFRRLKRSSQVKIIESQLEELNEKLGLERVSMVVDAPQFYVPVTEDGVRRLFKVAMPEENSHLNVAPIKVDSIENFGLTSGKRIYSNNTMRDAEAGLCLVATITEAVANYIGIESDVIWIPLADKVAENLIVINNNNI